MLPVSDLISIFCRYLALIKKSYVRTGDVTERPEAVEAGTAKLVGTNTERIMSEAGHLLDDKNAYMEMSTAHNPYGDGTASNKILEALRNDQ